MPRLRVLSRPAPQGLLTVYSTIFTAVLVDTARAGASGADRAPQAADDSGRRRRRTRPPPRPAAAPAAAPDAATTDAETERFGSLYVAYWPPRASAT